MTPELPAQKTNSCEVWGLCGRLCYHVEKDRGLYPASTSECGNLLRSLSDPHAPPNSTCWDEVDLNHDGTKPSHPLDTCSFVPTPPPSQWQESAKGIGRDAPALRAAGNTDTGAVFQDRVYPLTDMLLRVLSATFILSKNSRLLDAKSRLISANLG